MTPSQLWSVRLRSSRLENGLERHVSGAERLVSDSQLALTVMELFDRARQRGSDTVHVTTERVDAASCNHIRVLPIQTVSTDGPPDAGELAQQILIRAGVAPAVAHSALQSLYFGLGTNGTQLRGASLWDIVTGDRLEPNPERGVRTSRFDYSNSGVESIDSALAEAGLMHFRTKEAVAVATKTLWAGVSAELCWSDEPDYDTGYVASLIDGYVRLPCFKPVGAAGGRIFFLNSKTIPIATVLERLERAFVLIDPPTIIAPPVTARQFRKKL
jgi:6-carboxyhexanoate--CoA ligase